MSGSASQALARWVVDLRPDDLPADVVDYALYLLLDHLGCAARGSTVDTAESTGRALAALGAADDGVCTAVVGGAPARIEWAIFANGVHSHSIELDDTQRIFSNPSVQATEDYISGRFG